MISASRISQSNCDNRPSAHTSVQSANGDSHSHATRPPLQRTLTAPNSTNSRMILQGNRHQDDDDFQCNRATGFGLNNRLSLAPHSVEESSTADVSCRNASNADDSETSSDAMDMSPDLADPVVLSPSANTDGMIAGKPSSMSRRRQASNRPMLSLRVEIPPHGLSSESLSTLALGTNETPGLTPISGMITPMSLSRRFTTLVLSSAGPMTPRTPADQRICTPLLPPVLPRSTNPRRHIPGGSWATTPTEGVIPKLSYLDDNPTNYATMQLYRTSSLTDTWQETATSN